MMQADCEQVRDDLHAWALGALDADDAGRLEQHLAGCAECSALADEARDVAASIALAVPLQTASSSLKAKVMAGAAILEEVPRRKQIRTSRARAWWSVPAAAAVALGAGLVGWGVYNQGQVDDLEGQNAVVTGDATAEANKYATVRTQLIMAQDANEDLSDNISVMSEIVAQPDAVKLAMSGTDAAPQASGRYVWSRTVGKGSLVVQDLAPLPVDKSYCLWLIYEGDWVLAGQFSVGDDGSGSMIVEDLEIDPDAGPLKAFAVSIEPAGDVAKHTGATVLRADMSQ
jgi:anti-sigma factor RsiW